MFQDMELADHFLKFQRKVIRTNQGISCGSLITFVSAEDWKLAGSEQARHRAELLSDVCHSSIGGMVIPSHCSPRVATSQIGYWTEVDFGSDPVLHFLYRKISTSYK